MDNSTFIAYCQDQLRLVYERTKAGKPDEVLKHRTEGLLKAAQLLNLLSREETQALIQREHIEVFGESVESRKSKRQIYRQVRDSEVSDFFEIPAIIRRLQTDE